MTPRKFIALFVGALCISTPAAAETASWYSYESCLKEGSSGRYTASGELFDHEALTCASWQYPFGTRLKVTNLQNGKSVMVTVNDRGPAKRLLKKGRVLDLSKGAFAKIAKLKSGVVQIKVEVLPCQSQTLS